MQVPVGDLNRIRVLPGVGGQGGAVVCVAVPVQNNVFAGLAKVSLLKFRRVARGPTLRSYEGGKRRAISHCVLWTERRPARSHPNP